MYVHMLTTLSNMTKLKQNKITSSNTCLQEVPVHYITDKLC
jgi:hypothetical protein